MQRRGDVKLEFFQEDDARNTALVLMTNRFTGCIKFCFGSGTIEHVKFSEVNEFIFTGVLHVNWDSGSVVCKDVAPLFGGRIVTDPNLCRFTLEGWIEIKTQTQGENLTPPEHDPIQFGGIVLVELQNLVASKMFARRWHGGMVA